MAEELAFDQLFGDGGAVDLHERLVGPQRAGVQGPGHQLLARTAFPVNENPAVGGGGQLQLLPQGFHGNAVAHDAVAGAELVAQGAVFLGQPALVERVPDQQHGLVHRERLFQEVEGAQLGGLDRGLDGAVAGDHDDRRGGVALLEAPQDFQAVDAGQPDVEQEQVVVFLRRGFQAFLAGGYGVGFPAFFLEDVAQRGANAALVVDHQDGIGSHGLKPRARPPARLPGTGPRWGDCPRWRWCRGARPRCG